MDCVICLLINSSSFVHYVGIRPDFYVLIAVWVEFLWLIIMVCHYSWNCICGRDSISVKEISDYDK